MKVKTPVTSLILLITVATMSAAPQSTSRQPDDPRLGERKDISDKYLLARIRFGPPPSPYDHIGDGPVEWSHDYPHSGIHLAKILSELSKLQVNLDTNEYIFSFADPNLFKYPFAYLCEVGAMDLTDEEVAGMREYLLRGGFVIVDDFRGPYSFQVLEYNVRRALPEFEIKELDLKHPVFNCFFSIKTLDVLPPPLYRRQGLKPRFFGVEDKNGRLMMVINYNNDVSDYWQWSNDPFQPVDDTNEAYKFGVNYLFYAITH